MYVSLLEDQLLLKWVGEEWNLQRTRVRNEEEAPVTEGVSRWEVT